MRKKHVESKRRHHICVHILQQTLTDLKSISLIHSLYEICNKAINKGTATIQKCRYTSLCNNDRSCVHAFGIMTVVVVDEARSSTNLLLSMQHSTASKRMLYSFRSLIKKTSRIICSDKKKGVPVNAFFVQYFVSCLSTELNNAKRTCSHRKPAYAHNWIPVIAHSV